MRKIIIITTAWLLISSAGQAQEDYTYSVPENINDGLLTGHLANVGLDQGKISDGVRGILNKTYQDVHSFLIIKDGKLVLEEYFSGNKYEYDKPEFRGPLTDFDRETPHNLASVTKSITSAALGIAIEEGYIKSVDEKLFSYFPEYASHSDESKESISLGHLLTMTSGLEWNEGSASYGNSVNDIVQLFVVTNPIEYILKKPLVNAPASSFNYNGGGTNLLGEIIRKTSGKRLDELTAEYLFKPLGISESQWLMINPNLVYASGDLKMRPRDMAKFGYLYLNKGVWKDKKIISEDWVSKSLKKHVPLIPGKTGYGLHWWQKTYKVEARDINTFSADGWGGQKITLFPDLEMVVVFTGGSYTKQDSNDEIITRHILPGAIAVTEN